MTPLERFWAKVDREGPVPAARPDLGRCWLWTGGTCKGYGRFWDGEAVVPAHRWILEQLQGPLGSLDTDHLCRVHGCVRPTHLEAATRSENNSRGLVGAGGAARQLAKTHCPKGHEYATQGRPERGRRRCVPCETARQRKRRALRRVTA